MHAENEDAPKFGPWVRREVREPAPGMVCLFHIPIFGDPQFMMVGKLDGSTGDILDLAGCQVGYIIEDVEAWAEFQSW